MKLFFDISGTTIAEVDCNVVPPVGSEVIITMTRYKKGMFPGTILSFSVGDFSSPTYDFTDVDNPIVRIDVNGYTILKEGPSDSNS